MFKTGNISLFYYLTYIELIKRKTIFFWGGGVGGGVGALQQMYQLLGSLRLKSFSECRCCSSILFLVQFGFSIVLFNANI